MIVLIFLLTVASVSSLPVEAIPKAPSAKFNATALQEFLEVAQHLQNKVDPKNGLIPCWYYRSYEGEPYLTEPLYEYCLYVLGNDKKTMYLEGFAPDDYEEDERQHVHLAFEQPGLLYTQFSLIYTEVKRPRGMEDVQMQKFYCRTPACNIPASLRMYEVFQMKFRQLNKEKH